MAYDRPAAPDELAHLEEFLNSARFLYDEDALANVADARSWLRAHGHDQAASVLTDATRGELVEAREAIRDYLEGVTRAAERLTELAGESVLPPCWTPDGVRLPAVAGQPVRELIGRQLVLLAVEEFAGRRARFKICRAPDCRWAFYDRSPGNNSVWCSMSICGARHKMRAYRTRQRD